MMIMPRKRYLLQQGNLIRIAILKKFPTPATLTHCLYNRTKNWKFLRMRGWFL